MNSLSIVIPVYNNWAGTHQLLFDIYKNNSLVEEVILVDDCSPDPAVRDGIEWWKRSHMLPIEAITTKENLGFLRASNVGLNYAVEDVVCLISTDVRIWGDLVKLLKNYHENKLLDTMITGGRLYEVSTGWNEFDGRIFPYLEGWLLAASKRVWDGLGYFDEYFAPNDYEDIDFSTKALQAGYELFPLENRCAMNHLGAQSIQYGDGRSKLTEENRKKFQTKWLKK